MKKHDAIVSLRKKSDIAVPRIATRLCKQSLSKTVLSRGQHADCPCAMGHRCRLAGQSGQIFSIDLLVGIGAFLLIILLVAGNSNRLSEEIVEKESSEEMLGSTSLAAGALVLSQGYPSNWEKLADLNGVTVIGLAGNRNNLSVEKVEKIVDYNAAGYIAVKERLGLSKYEIYLSIESYGVGAEIYSFGTKPEAGKSIASVKRLSLLNNAIVMVTLETWKK